MHNGDSGVLKIISRALTTVGFDDSDAWKELKERKMSKK